MSNGSVHLDEPLLDAPEHIVRLFELEHASQVIGGVASPSEANIAVPRVTIYQHGEGTMLIVGCNLPEDLRQTIRSVDLSAALRDPAVVTTILEHDNPCTLVQARVTCAYSRPVHHPPHHYPVGRDGRWIIEVDGVVASEAWSATQNGSAASVRVDTLPEFRGQGFGGSVVTRWAEHVIESGRFAYYTYALDNAGSQALARKTGAIAFACGMKFY